MPHGVYSELKYGEFFVGRRGDLLRMTALR
jgi:hypothetical protein